MRTNLTSAQFVFFVRVFSSFCFGRVCGNLWCVSESRLKNSCEAGASRCADCIDSFVEREGFGRESGAPLFSQVLSSMVHCNPTTATTHITNMPKETNQNITDNDEVNALLNSSSTSRASPPIHRQSNALSSRPNRFAKLGCTVSILCTVYLLLAIHPTHQTARNQPRINQLPTNNNNRTNTPIFIFGHSTGHSGTGTFHQSLLQPGCPWDINATVDEFEYLAEGERKWNYDVECSLVRERLIPHLVEVVHGKAAYVDLGENRILPFILRTIL